MDKIPSVGFTLARPCPQSCIGWQSNHKKFVSTMKHQKLFSSLSLVMSLGLIATPALADSLTGAQILNQFNLVTIGSATSSSHVDGRSFIGGSLSGGVFDQHAADTPASSYAGLTVLGSAQNVIVDNFGAVIGGNLTNSTINSGSSVVLGNVSGVNFNGPAYVAGTTSGVNFNGGQNAALATGTAATASTSTNMGAVLSSLSSQLSQLSSTGSSVDISYGKATFNAVANGSGLAVFDLTSIDTAVFSANEFAFNLNGASTIIFNTDNTSANISANFLGGSAQAIGAKTIWNFYNATSLSINNQWGGSVLAPMASFSNGNNIEGGVYVNTLTQNGEIHLQPFAGQIAAVPEPETYAMLLAGLGLLGVVSRRRAKPQAA